MTTYTIADPREPHCVALVEAHWNEMGAIYGDTGPCEFQPEDISGPGCVFVVAWNDGAYIGCGAVRPYEGSEGEIKRVYVVPAARGKGVARSIMIHLEDHAQLLGYKSLR